MAEHLLVDLGGTHCRVGLADHRGFQSKTARRYASRDFADLTELLLSYQAEVGPTRPSDICAAVAGPVIGATAQLTNHAWYIDASKVSEAFGGVETHLLNDLQAQAYALDDLASDSVKKLFPGKPSPNGPRLVLGLGTGCNIAVAHRLGQTLFVPPAEAGHSTLPDASQFRALYDHLRQEMAHLPIESALSGPGLTRVHFHLTGRHLSPSDIISAAPNETLRTFVSILGLSASSLCITHMATGGLFLIGGVARAIAPYLDEMGFIKTFHPRGPYTGILENIPVYLIEDDHAALRGCARYLRQIL